MNLKCYLTGWVAATAMVGSLGVTAFYPERVGVVSQEPLPAEQPQHRGSGRLTGQGRSSEGAIAYRGSGRIDEETPEINAHRGSGRLEQDPLAHRMPTAYRGSGRIVPAPAAA
jgi:hypothetical protein